MAGDWIPMRTALMADGHVDAIASALNEGGRFPKWCCWDGEDPGPLRWSVVRHTVIGMLFGFWARMQEITCTGNVPFLSPREVDMMVDCPGFADAMTSVGWLEVDPDGHVIVPNWDEWNSDGAKRRIRDTVKKRSQRSGTPIVDNPKAKSDVPKSPGQCPVVNGTKGGLQNRTEQYIPPIVPQGGPTAEDIYKAYPKHVGQAAALRAINKAMSQDGVDGPMLLKRTQEYAYSQEHKRKTADWKFVPHPVTWFNRAGWEDESEQATAQITKTVQPGQPSRKEQAEMNERAQRCRDAGFEWWRKLSPERQAELRRKYPPVQSEGEVALLEFDRAGCPGFKE